MGNRHPAKGRVASSNPILCCRKLLVRAKPGLTPLADSGVWPTISGLTKLALVEGCGKPGNVEENERLA
jgi:hypothetical protein